MCGQVVCGQVVVCRWREEVGGGRLCVGGGRRREEAGGGRRREEEAEVHNQKQGKAARKDAGSF